ncbi:MAG: glycoside hydrolase family 97 protein [Candidatus Eisenbacteria bacterium]
MCARLMLMLGILVAAAGPAFPAVAPTRVLSPGGRIAFEFSLDDDGRPSYRVLHDERPVVEHSRLGFVLQDGPPLNRGFRLDRTHLRQGREEWEQPWGECRRIRAAYTELTVELVERDPPGRRMILTARLFDDGLGFRFTWPEQKTLGEFVILDEQTEFALAGDPVAWWIPAYAGNRYEYLYQRTRLSALAADAGLRAVHTPVTLETENGLYVSIHEAALTDYASMTLDPRPGSVLACDLVPWSDGARVRGSTPFQSPWRTIQIATHPGDLIESTLILNLNEPSRIHDTSWIRPGKYVGIWWSLHIGLETWQTGPHHGATSANAKRYIDFAAANGILGVLVEGWNVGWDQGWLDAGVFDFTTPTPDYDLAEVARYAREKGVTLIGHLETGGDVRGFEHHLDAAFAQFQRLGIRAVKTGYVSQGQGIQRYDEAGNPIAKEWQHGQYMVRHFRTVVERAAEYGIMVDVHEPIKDTGIRRTWPNMMTREGARGQEYNAWSEGNPPEHTVILPFTRLLSGPLDYTPGILNVLIKPYRPDNRVQGTVAKELALYVTIFSPLQMAADLPAEYAGNPAFGFIKDVAVDWEETRVLNAAIGDYVTIARRERGGDEWYLGSITDEHPRVFLVPLDFLSPEIDYEASIYADGPGADYLDNPTSMRITRERVNARTVLRIGLAPGGGQAIRFRPLAR